MIPVGIPIPFCGEIPWETLHVDHRLWRQLAKRLRGHDGCPAPGRHGGMVALRGNTDLIDALWQSGGSTTRATTWCGCRTWKGKGWYVMVKPPLIFKNILRLNYWRDLESVSHQYFFQPKQKERQSYKVASCYIPHPHFLSQSSGSRRRHWIHGLGWIARHLSTLGLPVAVLFTPKAVEMSAGTGDPCRYLLERQT